MIGESGPMEGPEQPVSGAIPGEYPSRAVGAMRGRSESNHNQARMRIAKSRNGSAPIHIIAVGQTLFECHLLSPLDKARAGPTPHDVVLERPKRILQCGRHPAILARIRPGHAPLTIQPQPTVL